MNFNIKPSSQDEMNTLAGSEEETSSMSLMGGVAKPEGLPEVDFDLDAMKARRQKISQGTMLLLAVGVVAAGTIYAMRIGQGDLNANKISADVMKKIETALARANPAASADASTQLIPVRSTFQDTESIVLMFNADVSQKQVPIEYVQRNPFALTVEENAQNKTVSASADAARLKEQVRKLEVEFNGLKLQSVMASARIPVVVIDGQFYKTGQQVGSFTILHIHDRGVDLQAEGFEKTLSMQDQASSPSRRR